MELLRQCHETALRIAPELFQRLPHLLPDSLLCDRRLEADRGIAPPLVHRHDGQRRNQLLGLLAQCLVAGEENGRHAVIGGEHSIEIKLTRPAPVHLDHLIVQIGGVGKIVARGIGPGMIPGHRRGVASLHARHHIAGNRDPASDEPDHLTFRQFLRNDISGRIMRILDADLVRFRILKTAGGQRSVTGSPHLACHLAREPVVAGLADFRLIPVIDPAGSFNIRTDE